MSDRLSDSAWTPDEVRRFRARYPNSPLPTPCQQEVNRLRAEMRRRALLARAAQMRAAWAFDARVNGADIRDAVCDAVQMRWSEIVSPRRSIELVRIRWAAMWLLKRYCQHLSLPMIGMICGNRDHSTVLHAVRKADAHLAAVAAGTEEPHTTDYVIGRVRKIMGEG